jgi:hypothetical protein
VNASERAGEQWGPQWADLLVGDWAAKMAGDLGSRKVALSALDLVYSKAVKMVVTEETWAAMTGILKASCLVER